MKNFKDKVVVITGAGSGIGKALALDFAARGALLALSDLNAVQLEETKNHCHTEVYTEVFDVSKKESFIDFANHVIQKFGRVDVVVNNAGVALSRAKITETTYEEFEWLMGINFWGVVYGTKEFLPHLLQRREAAIVNISSLFGLAGIAEQIPYCSSKFAVRGLTESLRMELLGTPVSVHTVHPGGIKTNIANNARMVEQTDKVEAVKDLEKFNENALRHTPEKAAQVIINGIMKGEEKIMIGVETYLADMTTKLLPTSYSKVFNYLKDRTL